MQDKQADAAAVRKAEDEQAAGWAAAAKPKVPAPPASSFPAHSGAAEQLVQAREQLAQVEEALEFAEGHDQEQLEASRAELLAGVAHLEEAEREKSLPGRFEAAGAFGGARAGLVFRVGGKGLGYYTDIPAADRAGSDPASNAQRARMAELERPVPEPAAETATRVLGETVPGYSRESACGTISMPAYTPIIDTSASAQGFAAAQAANAASARAPAPVPSFSQVSGMPVDDETGRCLQTLVVPPGGDEPLLTQVAAEAMRKANACFREGRHAKAGLIYTEIVEDSVGEGEPEGKGALSRAEHLLRANRAANALCLGAYEVAINDCTRILNRKPCDLQALVCRARAYVCVRTDLFSAMCAKSDLKMATMLEPDNRMWAGLLDEVVASLPVTEQKLMQLQLDDTSFWTVGERVMISTRHSTKLGGRGSLKRGESGSITNVDVSMQAGGRIQVQNDEGKKYWYDYEALVGCYAPCARLDRVRDPTPSNIVPPEPEPEREPEQEAERKPEPEPENSGMTEPELARSRLFQAQRAAAEAVVAAAAHDGLAQALQTAEEDAETDRLTAGGIRRALEAAAQDQAAGGGRGDNDDGWDDSDDGSDGDSSFAETEEDEDVIDDILDGIAASLGHS